MSLRDSLRFFIGILLLYGYLFMVYAIYRYVVVDFGLYFSAGYLNSLPLLTVTGVWLGFSFVLLLGQYTHIDSVYKLFSLLFLLLVCAPAILLGFMMRDVDFSSEMLFILSGTALALSAFSRWPAIRIKRFFSFSDGWWIFPGVILFGFALYLLVFYRGELSVVGVDEVYVKRALAKESSAPLLNYLTGWVYGFASPVLLVFGLLKRQCIPVVAGGSGFCFDVYDGWSQNGADNAVAYCIFLYVR
ncbi:hypothetical protein A471_10308 [Ectopseudomonas mendocina DLHK]|nr:hypothetical protein A471_10308 [Pseudomonas mendocina DLHK]